MRIYLYKEDCHCNLNDFYKNVAREMGETEAAGLFFDCRKICVTKPVHDEIWENYREDGYSNMEIAQLLLNMGPKANLKGEDLMVEVEEGFLINYQPATFD